MALKQPRSPSYLSTSQIYPTASELNRGPPTTLRLVIRGWHLATLHSPVVMTGSEAGVQMDNPGGSFSSFFLPLGCSFNSGSQMLWSLIIHCSWKHRMSELKRKNLIINNSYKHLLNTYSVPGPMPGMFPGITSFNFPNNSGRQVPLSLLFYRKETEALRRLQGISQTVLSGPQW